MAEDGEFFQHDCLYFSLNFERNSSYFVVDPHYQYLFLSEIYAKLNCDRQGKGWTQPIKFKAKNLQEFHLFL